MTLVQYSILIQIMELFLNKCQIRQLSPISIIPNWIDHSYNHGSLLANVCWFYYLLKLLAGLSKKSSASKLKSNEKLHDYFFSDL